MKFLLDENVGYRLALWLRKEGHDVTAIAHDYPHALADHEVLAIAVKEQRILITNDRDFGDLIVRQGLAHAGLLYFRYPASRPQTDILVRLRELLAMNVVQPNQVLVITPLRVR